VKLSPETLAAIDAAIGGVAERDAALTVGRAPKHRLS